MKMILVSDIMTQEPITADLGTNLLDCAKIMVRKRVGSILLVSNKKLIGFISEKDILWAIIKKPKLNLSKIRAIDISIKKIATIKPFATLKEAMEKMKKLKFDRLPVIDKGKLVGVITRKDILSFNPELYPELEEFEQIREETEKLKRFKKAMSMNLVSEGICGECGNSGELYWIDGLLICEDCRNSM
ncbi:MAG TPA: CBS domain-containing protein [Candidatus Nanoarchaeia archaeon]|nr:CBS domain-containing protein [Candidatus Nanoarchaeia archaeon]